MDLEKLDVGQVEEVACRKGWVCQLTKTSEGFDVTLFNPVEGGGQKFYNVSTAGHPYGAPMVNQEPTLGIPCRKAGIDVNGNIVGAMILDDKGKVIERFSWSNIVYAKGQTLDITSDGQLIVGGQPKGFVQKIFLPDKNRLRGYVGVFGPQKAESVRIFEIEDLLLAQ